MHDPGAAERLWATVQRAFVTPGKVTNKSQLHEATGIGRTTLDNWFVKGVQPTHEGMRQIADALGVEPALLWLRWLDLPPPRDDLGRIADEIRELRLALSPSGQDDPEMEQRLDAAAARHASQSERRLGDRRGGAEG